MRSRSRLGMPMPWSRTITSTHVPSVRARTSTVLPFSLYLTALSTRLVTAETSWRRSPTTLSEGPARGLQRVPVVGDEVAAAVREPAPLGRVLDDHQRPRRPLRVLERH